MSLYLVTLFAHSYLRWAVLVAVVCVLVRTFLGWRRAGAWTRVDERLHVALVGFTDLQFTLGVALYLFMSPLPQAFFADPAGTMKVRVVRFFGLEHPVMMLLAVALVHIGRSRSRKAATPASRHRVVFTTTSIALLILCASIPWPGLDHGRPLLRGAPSGTSRACEPCTAGESDRAQTTVSSASGRRVVRRTQKSRAADTASRPAVRPIQIPRRPNSSSNASRYPSGSAST
jgi:hypothetical protein